MLVPPVRASLVSVAVTAAVLLAGACGPAPSPQAVVTIEGAPPGSSSASASAPPPPISLRCDSPPPPVRSHPPLAEYKPHSQQQETELAAAAFRLFQAERWLEARTALTGVASGQAGDVRDIQQKAEYDLAICSYKLGEKTRAAEELEKIAKDRAHARHRETMLWLLKLDAEGSRPMDIRLIAFFEEDTIDRFNNPQQRDMFWQGSYLLGRFRYERGELDKAAAAFQRVPATSPYGGDAARCLAQLKAAAEKK